MVRPLQATQRSRGVSLSKSGCRLRTSRPAISQTDARLTLLNAAGEVVTTTSHSFEMAAGGSVELLNNDRRYRGDVSVLHGSDYIEALFGHGDVLPAGMISGRAGLEAGWVENAAERIYYFRNNVTYVGTRVPEVFAHLAGTYTGTSYDPKLSGASGEVTVTVTAAGEVTMAGTDPLTRQAHTGTFTWDGNDDLIAPNLRSNGDTVENVPGEFRLTINENHGYGSLPKGGMWLTLPVLETLAATPAVLSARRVQRGRHHRGARVHAQLTDDLAARRAETAQKQSAYGSACSGRRRLTHGHGSRAAHQGA